MYQVIERLTRTLLPTARARLTVCVGVVNEGRILLVREGGWHKRGRWNLPGGRVDRGEALQAAAVREVAEEAGCRIRLMGVCGVHRYRSGLFGDVLRVSFVGRLVACEPRPNGNETLEVGWFDLDELCRGGGPELQRPKLLRTIFKRVRSGAQYPLALLDDTIASSCQNDVP